MQYQYAQSTPTQYAQPTPTTFSPAGFSGAFPSSGVQQYRSSGAYPSSGVISNGLTQPLGSFPSPVSQSIPFAPTQYSSPAPVASPVTYSKMPGTIGEVTVETKPVSSSRGVPVSLTAPSNGSYLSREQVLEKKVKDLEAQLKVKDQNIQELQSALSAARGKDSKENGRGKARSPSRGSGSGFRKLSASNPSVRYNAVDQDDPIDVRLEEFYNSTGSAIPFHRINRGFYRFGETIVEVDIINHKLMARTEDGWNRGKFGPVEKFLGFYENTEREKAGILPES